MSDFKMSIGPGNVIGAVAVGANTKAEGTVSVGGAKAEAAPNGIRCKLEIRHMTPTDAAAWLRTFAEQLDKNGNTPITWAKGDVQGGVGKGVAWSVEREDT